MPRIFLSHSSIDEAEAIALKDWLVAQGWGDEDDVFLDLDPKRGLAGGERWEEALRRNVRRCEAVVFVVTSAWCNSKWCFSELQLAKNFNKPIFGVIGKETKFSDIPREMTSEWQVVDLTRVGDRESFTVTAVTDGKEHTVSFNTSELIRLKSGLENCGIDPRYFAWPPEDDLQRAPFPGLRAMQKQDAGIFFGRDAQILAGMDQLRGLNETPPPRMLVILGASGAGKSSYMRAGLLPRLERDDRHFVVMNPIRPGQRAITGDDGFASSLSGLLDQYEVSASLNQIKQALTAAALQSESVDNDTAQGVSLLSMLGKVCERANVAHSDPQSDKAQPDKEPFGSGLPSIVVPIDQAEELYLVSEGDHKHEAEQLRQLLALLTKQTQVNIIVLLTIRSDSYQHIQLDTVLGSVEHQTQSLPPVSQGAYLQIIEGPAARLSKDSDRTLVIEDTLKERLLKDIAEGGAKDALPLLAFTLERLYNEYLEDDKLTLAHYEDMGGISGSIEIAVKQALENAKAHSEQEQQHQLALLKRGLIPWLATVDPESQEAVRRVAPFTSVPEEARPIMELLVEQRLLSTDIRVVKDSRGNVQQDKQGYPVTEVTIEPAHEALLRQWGQLKEWLKEDRDTLSALDGVKRAVQEWEANAKSEAFLVHSAGRLETAEQASAQDGFNTYLRALERDYLAVCRTMDNERKNQELEQQKKITQRTRLGLITATILTIVASIAGWIAFDKAGDLKTERDASNKLAESLEETNESLEQETRRALEAEKNARDSEQKTKRFAGDLKAERDASNELAKSLAETNESLEDRTKAANSAKELAKKNEADAVKAKQDAQAALETVRLKTEELEQETRRAQKAEKDARDSEQKTKRLYRKSALARSQRLQKDAKFLLKNNRYIAATEKIISAYREENAVRENLAPSHKLLELHSELHTLDPFLTQYGEKDDISSFHIAGNGKNLTTIENDTLQATSALTVYDIETGLKLHELEVSEINDIFDFSEDGIIAVISRYNAVEVWNIQEKTKICEYNNPEEQVLNVEINQDNIHVLSWYGDNQTHIWTLDSCNNIDTYSDTPIHKDDLSDYKLHGRFSNNGNHIITASDYNTVVLREWKSGEFIKIDTANHYSNEDEFLKKIILDFNDKKIGLITDYGYAYILDFDKPIKPVLLNGSQQKVEDLAFSGNGKLFATLGASLDVFLSENMDVHEVLETDDISSIKFKNGKKNILLAETKDPNFVTVYDFNLTSNEEPSLLASDFVSIDNIRPYYHGNNNNIQFSKHENAIFLIDDTGRLFRRKINQTAGFLKKVLLTGQTSSIANSTLEFRISLNSSEPILYSGHQFEIQQTIKSNIENIHDIYFLETTNQFIIKGNSKKQDAFVVELYEFDSNQDELNPIKSIQLGLSYRASKSVFIPEKQLLLVIEPTEKKYTVNLIDATSLKSKYKEIFDYPFISVNIDSLINGYTYNDYNDEILVSFDSAIKEMFLTGKNAKNKRIISSDLKQESNSIFIDKYLLVSTVGKNKIELHDLQSKYKTPLDVNEYSSFDTEPHLISLQDDNKFLVVSNGEADNEFTNESKSKIEFWRVTERKKLERIKTITFSNYRFSSLASPTLGVKINNENNRLLVKHGASVTLWDIQNINFVNDLGIWQEAGFTEDGKIITYHPDKGKKIWRNEELNNYSYDLLLARQYLNLPFLSTSEETKFNIAKSINNCDQLGGAPYDTSRLGASISDDDLFIKGALAIEFCKEAIMQFPNEPRYYFQLARVYRVFNNFTDSIKYYLEASKLGYAAADYDLGRIYENFTDEEGESVSNYEKSAHYLRKAYQNGFEKAAGPLANHYLNGHGLDTDIEKALEILRKSAQIGDAESHLSLGRLYLLGVKSDTNTILEYDKKNAFFHYALATRLFRKEGGSSKKFNQNIVANLARTLREDDVIRIWKKAQAWKPTN